jgi:hypothetical protein
VKINFVASGQWFMQQMRQTDSQSSLSGWQTSILTLSISGLLAMLHQMWSFTTSGIDTISILFCISVVFGWSVATLANISHDHLIISDIGLLAFYLALNFYLLQPIKYVH